jgi:hypothetical protein
MLTPGNSGQFQVSLARVGDVLVLIVLMFTVACSPWQLGAEKDLVKNGIKFNTFGEKI